MYTANAHCTLLLLLLLLLLNHANPFDDGTLVGCRFMQFHKRLKANSFVNFVSSNKAWSLSVRARQVVIIVHCIRILYMHVCQC